MTDHQICGSAGSQWGHLHDSLLGKCRVNAAVGEREGKLSQFKFPRGACIDLSMMFHYKDIDVVNRQRIPAPNYSSVGHMIVWSNECDECLY